MLSFDILLLGYVCNIFCEFAFLLSASFLPLVISALMSPKIFEKQSDAKNEMERRAMGLVKVLDCEPCDRVSNPGSESSNEQRGGPREAFRRSRRNSFDRVLDSGLSKMHSLEGLVERVSPLEEFNTAQEPVQCEGQHQTKGEQPRLMRKRQMSFGN